MGGREAGREGGRRTYKGISFSEVSLDEKSAITLCIYSMNVLVLRTLNKDPLKRGINTMHKCNCPLRVSSHVVAQPCVGMELALVQ